MSIFKKALPSRQIDYTAEKLSATISGVVPIFLEAITQNANDFIQNFKQRDPTLKGRIPEWTDELAVETYGLNRKEVALTALKAYLIFSVQEYLSIQHLLDKKGRKQLVDRMVFLLTDDRSKNCFEKEWAKIVQTPGDNVRKKELFIGNLLSSLALVDSSFFADDLNKIWHHYVTPIEAMSSCVILHVDKVLNPRNHPTQKQLTDEYLLALSDYRLDRKGIQQILERE
jgi:hypothetical protein